MPTVHNKYHNTAPAGAVYIGRPTIWGNPYSVDDYGREKAVKLYCHWIQSHPVLVEQAKRQLAGKDLVCFCAPKLCHGDVLMAIANGTPMPSLTKDGYEQKEEDTERA